MSQHDQVRYRIRRRGASCLLSPPLGITQYYLRRLPLEQQQTELIAIDLDRESSVRIDGIVAPAAVGGGVAAQTRQLQRSVHRVLATGESNRGLRQTVVIVVCRAAE